MMEPAPDVLARADRRIEQRLVEYRSLVDAEPPTALTPAQVEERSTISLSEMGNPHVDAFRELRTRLIAATRNDDGIIILVAPVSRGSGGSFVARNLAAAFAFDDATSAVLVDCDLFAASQHETMRVEADKGGLVNYLENPSTLVGSMLYHTGIPRLLLLPAGISSGDHAEYLSSFRMRLLVDVLRSRSPLRHVILDSPPVNGAPDARILADLADVVILVSGYGRDRPEQIARAAANFDPHKFAGVVFNEGA
ncbi:polysaccharide biosynthesis protein [Luteimonas arsenica]|uniref:polysaccharide biosynthesis protein n=1 Tax=Luteimonas arsenica TaxID=1586242 RepID=UPI0010566AE3|nr:polysaccharide biosynthesis protein [Luteimonas arsenica]